MCSRSNVGSATSDFATLTVNPKPTITKQPASLTVAAGDTATFTIKRDRKSSEIEMKLAEYVPSTDKSSKSSNKLYQYNSDDSWRDSINW